MREITQRLRKKDMDIRQVYSSLSDIKSDLAAIRANVHEKCNLVVPRGFRIGKSSWYK